MHKSEINYIFLLKSDQISCRLEMDLVNNYFFLHKELTNGLFFIIFLFKYKVLLV